MSTQPIYPSMDELVDTLIDNLTFYRVKHCTDAYGAEKVEVGYDKVVTRQADWWNDTSTKTNNVADGYIFKAVDKYKVGDKVVVANLNGDMKVAVVTLVMDEQPTTYRGRIAWIVGSVDTSQLNKLLKLEDALKYKLVNGQRNTMRANAIRNLFGDAEIPTLEDMGD